MKVLVTIIFIIIGITVKGQINVGIKNDSLIIVPMNIFIDVDYPDFSSSVNIDLDNNNITDIQLKCYVQAGGPGFASNSDIRGSDNTYIISDTFEVYYYEDSSYMQIESFATKLDSGQTIYNTDYAVTVSNILKYSVYEGELIVSVEHWKDNQIHFVGFIKNINGTDYLGWIKIKVIGRSSFYVYEWALQDYGVSIPEDKIPIKVISTSYYNLLGQEITKPIEGYYIEIKLTNRGVISTKHFKQ